MWKLTSIRRWCAPSQEQLGIRAKQQDGFTRERAPQARIVLLVPKEHGAPHGRGGRVLSRQLSVGVVPEAVTRGGEPRDEYQRGIGGAFKDQGRLFSG